MKDRRSYASKRNYVCMIISWKHLCTLNSTCAYLCEKVPGGSQHSGWALPRPPPPGAGLPEPQGLLPETRASSLCKQRQDNNWFTPENKHREINFNQVMLYFLLLYMIGALAQDQSGWKTHRASPLQVKAIYTLFRQFLRWVMMSVK